VARLAVCTCLAVLGLAAPASGAVLVHSIPKRFPVRFRSEGV
jgi:hypothetical protein